MPKYFHNNTEISEERIFDIANSLGLSIEEYLSENDEITVEESEELDIVETESEESPSTSQGRFDFGCEQDQSRIKI